MGFNQQQSMRRRSPKEVLLMTVVTFIQIFFAFNMFEHIVDKWRYAQFPEILASIAAFVAAVICLLYCFRFAGRRIKVSLVLVLLVLGIVGVLDVGVKMVESSQSAYFEIEENDILIETFSAGQSVPDPFKVLVSKDVTDGKIVVFGKPRSEMKRFLGMRVSYEAFGERIIKELVPEDFAEYAGTIYPEKDVLANEERLGDYLMWQFPDYVYYLVRFDQSGQEDASIHFSEDNRMGRQGIYSVDPFIKEIVRGRIGARFYAYKNLITFLFASPHYRTDLMDDPYFLIQHGALDKAREIIKTLPPGPRKEFLELKITP